MIFLKSLEEITICHDSKRRPLNSQERMALQKNPLYPYIGANNILDYVDDYIFDMEILCLAEDGGSWGYNEKCSFIFNGKCWVNNHTHVLTAKPEADLKFLMYYLNYNDLNKYITGSTRGKLTKSSMNKIQIPLPPLPIQQKIAAVLDKADAIRKRSQQILAKYDQLAQSVFLEMFEKNQYEILLGKSLLKIQGGAAFKSTDYQSTGIPVIRIGTVNKGYFDESQIVFLPENFLKSHSKYILKPGDLLLTLTGTVGKEDYGNLFVLGNQYPEYFLNQRVAKLELNEKMLRVQYFKFFLEQPQIKSKLIGVSRGVRQANISNGDIYNLEINVPPIELQNKFASIIAQIEKQKAQTQLELDRAEELYQSLLQQAFQGDLFSDN